MLTVAAPDAGQRLDRFIASRGGVSRGLARRALGVGGVFLDGRRCKVAARAVRPGQQVVVNLAEGGLVPGDAAALAPDRILHADRHLVAVDKPPGVAAQATLTHDRGSLPDLVARLLGGEVAVVHRLDRETSGVTVLARTRETAAALAAAFRQGRPEKTYLALTAGAPEPPEGRLEAPLRGDRRRPGRRRVAASGQPAATRFRTLRTGPGAALVECRPETGRTHQVRAHLAHLGAPILGDRRYGGPQRVGEVSIPRAMLHAWRLEVAHPGTGERLVLTAPVPDDFRAVERALLPGSGERHESPERHESTHFASIRQREGS